MNLVCKDLKFEHDCDFYSPEIEKLIKANKKLKEKATVNVYDSELIITMYELWDAKILTVPGRNGIEALAKFIHETYNLPKKNGCKGYLSLSSIKTKLYEIKGKN